MNEPIDFNPQQVSKWSIGLGRVNNTSDADKPVSAEQQAAINAHALNTGNPHNVTKAQVGLGNVDNTADMDKPVSRAQASAMDAIAHGVVSFVSEDDLSATVFVGSSVELIEGTSPYPFATITLYL